MAISVDVDLSGRPRILGPGAAISETIEVAGGLGSTKINSSALTDAVSAVVTLDGTLTGGRIAMSGSISAVVDPSATRRRLWMQQAPTNYAWYYDGYDEYPWAWISKNRALIDDTNPEEDPVYPSQMYVRDSLLVTVTVPLVVPSPPAPAPPAPPEAPGDFPMPVSGGITIRALHGVVVDMDTPTVVDGIPT